MPECFGIHSDAALEGAFRPSLLYPNGYGINPIAEKFHDIRVRGLPESIAIIAPWTSKHGLARLSRPVERIEANCPTPGLEFTRSRSACSSRQSSASHQLGNRLDEAAFECRTSYGRWLRSSSIRVPPSVHQGRLYSRRAFTAFRTILLRQHWRILKLMLENGTTGGTIPAERSTNDVRTRIQRAAIGPCEFL